jgi:glycosyltransferase involved in cell wall biosynthesis
MTGRRKKARASERREAAATREAGLPAVYWDACRLAEQGRYEEARTLYAQLKSEAPDLRVRTLIANDLAVLAALEGRTDEALGGWNSALASDADCLPARLNRDFLTAELALAEATPATGELVLAPNPSAHLSVTIDPPSHAKSVRVAILSFLFNWPSTGGGTVHTYELAKFLARDGYEVAHIYARHDEWGIGGVQGHLPYPSEVLQFESRDWSLSHIQARFRRAVQAFDPDHVIITDSWNIKPLLAEAVRDYPCILRLQALECLCPLNNVRLLIDEGGEFRQCPLHQLASPSECCRCLMERGQMSGPLHQAERELCEVGTQRYHDSLLRAFRDAEAVLVVNPLTEAMVSPYARCVKVVTAGMDAGRFPWPAPEVSRERWADGRRVLFFGGLVGEPMKGFRVLQEACRKLWRKRKDFVLAATADPPDEVDEFTRFVGWCSQDDLPGQLHAADIVVFPTIAQEALGRTAVEAMAAGRPVVASRIGGLPFTIVDGTTGLLFEPGDSDDLARKLETLLDDADLRERMGLAGRKRFEEHYAWNVIIDRHYRPLLKRREPRTPGKGHAPFIPQLREFTDETRLFDDLSRFFGLAPEDIDRRWGSYHAFHREQHYEETLGEHKTLCLEEAFVLFVALDLVRPGTIVEIGTGSGKSTRRILDMVRLLALDSRVVCFDAYDEVFYFQAPEEAQLIVGDLVGRFRNDVLENYQPELIFLDVHSYRVLREAILEVLMHAGPCVLAIHDCGSGLCNPKMSIDRDDPVVTSFTGVWERHILSEIFGITDPLDPRLDAVESPTHRLAVFGTRHGLGVIWPRVMSRPPEKLVTASGAG